MAIEIFNRYESKYIIDVGIYDYICSELLKHTRQDEYNISGRPYTISNIYYDTIDDRLIKASLAKPRYKEKIRMRAYGIPQKNDKVFIEIKKKYNGIVNKRRSTIELHEGYRFMQAKKAENIKPYMNEQVIHEIEYAAEFYKLMPKTYIAYDRVAFFGIDNPELRITIDKNIRSRREYLLLEAGDFGRLLLPRNKRLMEIKTDGSIPLWLTQLLSENNIYKTSFSKYGVEYKTKLEEKLNYGKEAV